MGLVSYIHTVSQREGMEYEGSLAREGQKKKEMPAPYNMSKSEDKGKV